MVDVMKKIKQKELRKATATVKLNEETFNSVVI